MAAQLFLHPYDVNEVQIAEFLRQVLFKLASASNGE